MTNFIIRHTTLNTHPPNFSVNQTLAGYVRSRKLDVSAVASHFWRVGQIAY